MRASSLQLWQKVRTLGAVRTKYQKGCVLLCFQNDAVSPFGNSSHGTGQCKCHLSTFGPITLDEPCRTALRSSVASSVQRQLHIASSLGIKCIVNQHSSQVSLVKKVGGKCLALHSHTTQFKPTRQRDHFHCMCRLLRRSTPSLLQQLMMHISALLLLTKSTSKLSWFSKLVGGNWKVNGLGYACRITHLCNSA